MPWLKLEYRVDTAFADELEDVLQECGAVAVTHQNAGDDEFYEVAFPGTPDWRQLCITGLFDAETDGESVHAVVSDRLADRTVFRYEQSVLDDEDWERAWMDSFRPIRVGNELWVCPTDAEPPEPDATNIRIDPGLAFGTGTHATTAMCLQWISTADLEDKVVLDYGCGSGILGVAAAMRGARKVHCVDIDPQAVSATIINAERNSVAHILVASLPGQETAEMVADVVIVNILADVIVELAAGLIPAVEKGGQLLLTGILDRQVDRVRAAFSDNFEFEIRNSGQWRLLIGNIKV